MLVRWFCSTFRTSFHDIVGMARLPSFILFHPAMLILDADRTAGQRYLSNDTVKTAASQGLCYLLNTLATKIRISDGDVWWIIDVISKPMAAAVLTLGRRRRRWRCSSLGPSRASLRRQGRGRVWRWVLLLGLHWSIFSIYLLLLPVSLIEVFLKKTSSFLSPFFLVERRRLNKWQAQFWYGELILFLARIID